MTLCRQTVTPGTFWKPLCISSHLSLARVCPGLHKYPKHPETALFCESLWMCVRAYSNMAHIWLTGSTHDQPSISRKRRGCTGEWRLFSWNRSPIHWIWTGWLTPRTAMLDTKNSGNCHRFSCGSAVVYLQHNNDEQLEEKRRHSNRDTNRPKRVILNVSLFQMSKKRKKTSRL